MQSTRCPKCGKDIPEESIFCNYCGEKIVLPTGNDVDSDNSNAIKDFVSNENKEVMQDSEPVLQAKNTKPQNRKKTLITVSIIVLFIACSAFCAVGFPAIAASRKEAAAVASFESGLEYINSRPITADDKSKIELLRVTYNKFSESEKNKVTKLALLKTAEARLAEAEIDGIGTVSADKVKQIAEIRKYYDLLDDDQKAQVSNYATLQAAESKVSEIEIENTITLIDKIGIVSLDSNSKILAAENAYRIMKESDKAKVTNFTVLQDARKKYDFLKSQQTQKEQQEEAKIKAAYDAENKEKKDTLIVDSNGKKIWKIYIPDGTFTFSGTYKGTGNWIVQILDSNQDLVDVLCNEIGDYVIESKSIDVAPECYYYFEIFVSEGSYTCSWSGTMGN